MWQQDALWNMHNAIGQILFIHASLSLTHTHKSQTLRGIQYEMNDRVGTYHSRQTGSWQHELHLLGQHGCSRLLLDQVVPSIDLQLTLQVRWRVQVFTVIPWTPTLKCKPWKSVKSVGEFLKLRLNKPKLASRVSKFNLIILIWTDKQTEHRGYASIIAMQIPPPPTPPRNHCFYLSIHTASVYLIWQLVSG